MAPPPSKMKQRKLGECKRTVPNSDALKLELKQRGTPVPTLQDPAALQQLKAIYNEYDDAAKEMANSRKDLALPAVKRQRRRSNLLSQSNSQLSQEEPEAHIKAGRIADLQYDAMRYMRALDDHTSASRIPARGELERLENMMRQHALHSSAEPAQHAFRLLLQYIHRFPAAQLQHYPAGSPFGGMAYVEEHANAWTLLGSMMRRRHMFKQEADVERCHPERFFFDLWFSAAHLAEGLDDPAIVEEHFGQVLLLRAAVAQLQAELAPRLAAFRATAGPGVVSGAAAGETEAGAEKRDAELQEHRRWLLEESHLWRLLKEVPTIGDSFSRPALVELLVRVIAAGGADGPQAPRCSRLITRQELKDLGAKMLRMLLELYGTAEASRYYSSVASERFRQADLYNQRNLLNMHLIAKVFLNNDAVVHSWEERQAVLGVLRPRDRLRLLGMLMAEKRVTRQSDADKYSSMDNARDASSNKGEMSGFIDVDPAEVLRYIGDNISWAQAATNKSADDLALVVAYLARGAAMYLNPLDPVITAYTQVHGAMLERHSRQGKAERLSPKSQAELQGAAKLLHIVQHNKPEK